MSTPNPGHGQRNWSEAWPAPAMSLTGHSHSEWGHALGHLPTEDPREIAARAREDLLRRRRATDRASLIGSHPLERNGHGKAFDVARNYPGTYRSARDLQVNVFGVPKRPFEVITASVLGFIAPFFVLAALVWMAFTGGRAFRIVGWVLRKIGDLTDTAVLSWAGDLSSGIATGIVAIAFVVGLIVIVGFTAYAWRLAVGRGRARWVAMGCLGLAFVVMTPLNPLLIGCFLLFGTASIVFAFLPRSSAWFARGR